MVAHRSELVHGDSTDRSFGVRSWHDSNVAGAARIAAFQFYLGRECRDVEAVQIQCATPSTKYASIKPYQKKL